MLVDRTLQLLAKAVPPGLARSLFGQFVPVFLMHRLVDWDGNTSDKKVYRLRQYLSFLQEEGYCVLSMQELMHLLSANEPIPAKAVLFTIDDGYFDQFEIAGNIFSEFRYPLTLYAVTGLLDNQLWPWDDQVKHVLKSCHKDTFKIKLPSGELFTYFREGLDLNIQVADLQQKLKKGCHSNMYEWLVGLYHVAGVENTPSPPEAHKPGSWSIAQSFIDAGHCVGAHTVSHRILSKLTEMEAEQEIEQSITIVKKRLVGTSNTFAFPTGRGCDFGKRDSDIVRVAGCDAAFSTIPEAISQKPDMFALPRYALPSTMSHFIQYLTFIEVAKNRVRSLVRGGRR